jgi:hypothetical protein
MVMTDDRIEPWLGAMGQDRPLFSVLKARSTRLGWRPAAGHARHVKGRDMRGAGVASVLKTVSRVRSHNRQVRLYHRIIRLDGAGREKVVRHLDYLTRSGKGRAGDSPELYSDMPANAQRHQFGNLVGDHRHQFRIVIEPENGWEFPDFQQLVGRLMTQVSADLHVELDWVAADHFDNGMPHSHIVIAGRDRQGEDILIAPTYLRDGLAARAADLVSLDLGPRSHAEPDISRDIAAERVTDLDLDLVGRSDAGRLVDPTRAAGAHQGLLTRRLVMLASLRLARREPLGVWRLHEDMLSELSRIDDRNRQWAFLHDRIVERHPERPLSDLAVWDPRHQEMVAGRILEVEQLSRDECAIILDSVAGQLVRVEGCSDVALRPDMIVKLGGRGPVDDGGAASSRRIEILSVQPIGQLIRSSEHNWLDQIASQDPPVSLGDGFGHVVREALCQRDAWLRHRSLDHSPGRETEWYQI